MKTCLFFLMTLVLQTSMYAQEKQSTWSFEAAMNVYFLSDGTILLPVFEADKNHLHLESRYNYEDLQTISVWGGYNFYGGKKLAYSITPMAGVVAGLSNGFAMGLEFELTLAGFTLYSESEQLFDLNTIENDFFYAWTDFTYAPLEWLFFGISGQRTRLYETNTEIQHGLIVGSAFGDFEASAYFYNPELDDRFVLISLSYTF